MAVDIIVLMNHHQSAAALKKSERIQSYKWFELRMKGKVKFGHGINSIVRQMAQGKRFPSFFFHYFRLNDCTNNI